MRTSWLTRRIRGAIGLGLLALPLVTLGAPRSGVYTHAAVPMWLVDWTGISSTSYSNTMREAAFWRGQALQLPDDEADEARAALQTWDRAAPFDRHAERQRALMADHAGYRHRALALLDKAERLASSAAERGRVARRRQCWEALMLGTGTGSPHGPSRPV